MLIRLVRPYEELSWRWQQCHRTWSFRSTTIPRVKMVEQTLMMVHWCNRVWIIWQSINRWCTGKVDTVSIVAATVRRQLVVVVDQRRFLLRLGSHFQTLCSSTNWKRATGNCFHVIPIHLKVRHCIHSSEFDRCYVICLSCFFLSSYKIMIILSS